MSDRLSFSSSDVLIVADDLVAEVFAFQSSLRVPVARLGIQVRPAKHDQINVQFGYVNDADQPLYGPDVKLAFGSKGFSLPSADEPRLRAFAESLESQRTASP